MGTKHIATPLAFVALLNLVAHCLFVGFVLGCHDVERQALSKFKLSFFSDPYESLSSWEGMDCCLWEGVACNNVTGSVTLLDLSGNGLSALKLDPSLIVLRELSHLDLNSNDLQGTQIPGFIGSFKHLTYLDLTHANFSAVLPPQLGNLTRLQHLGLSGPMIDYHEWARTLVNSQQMDINDVLISNTRNTMQVVTNLPSLTYLALGSCGLVSTPHFYTLLSNLTSFYRIQNLDLSDNLLAGPFSNVFANMSSLVDLDLSGNLLNGSIPLWLRDMRNLDSLDLSRNFFSQVEGGILDTFLQLSVLFLDSNSLEGELGGPLGNFSKDVTPNLVEVGLSHNKIRGSLPFWLGELRSLKYLDLDNNNLEGVVSDTHLANLPHLEDLTLDNNHLNLKFSDDWVPKFRLSELSLSSCTIAAQLPPWIKSQTSIGELDLSNTDISGESLHFLCQFTYLTFLDLHQNQFSGTIPECLNNSLQFIDFSSNKLSGSIPQSIGQLERLNLLYLNNNSLDGEIPHTLSSLSNLIIMDVGENNLSGCIPDLKSNSLLSLRFLRMRSNKLVGVIPEHMCALPSIQLLDLANNNLSGTIPPCFGHLGRMGLPSSVITNLDNTSYFSLKGNAVEVIKGAEQKYTSTLQFLVDLDLSCNKLVGSIPESITNLSGLIGFNLSHNRLSGGIPRKIGEMSSLESLDLSNNRLYGTIPSSLAAITSLEILNLSNNQLSGQIPTGTQLQTLNDPSIYAGNTRLCGDPLPNKCGTINAQQQQLQQEQESDKEDPRDKIWLYFVVFSGFATGFWGFVGSLLLKKRFRFALFHILSNITDYVYVQTMVRINRLRN